MKPPELSFEKFAALYCETQEQTPEGLHEALSAQQRRFDCEGFMLLRCVMMDSSHFGQRVILPYGPNNTYRTVPDHCVSPRDLASDMSEVEAVWDPIGLV